jgi:tRNA dimethylallyltransferase
VVWLQVTDEIRSYKARSLTYKVHYLYAVKKLIVIVGPTAVGKTAAAIGVAEKLGTEIISADSRQVFKELNIGTAKPSPTELKEVKHHFIGNKSICENYDAGQYGRDAIALIHELFKKYDWLVMVGGSGLYLKAALEGFDPLPPVPDGMRAEITVEYLNKGLGWLQQEVANADPIYFSTVDQQNPQRLIRALELLRTSGKPLHQVRANKKIDHPFEIIKLGLNIPREELYQRIDSRMDHMIAMGLFEEARQLYPHKHLNALQTVGYREIFAHLDGQYDYDEALRLLKRNSRRYAKRQLTWFLGDGDIRWFPNAGEMSTWLSKNEFSGG